MNLKRLIQTVLVFAFCLLVACTPRYIPPSITIPGGISKVEVKNHYFGVFSWKYDEQMLVYNANCNECGTRAALYTFNWKTDTLEKVPLQGYLPDRNSLAQGPTPDWIAYTINDAIHRFNLKTHLDEKVVDGDTPSFSPDGSQLAFSRGPNVLIYDFKTGQERPVFLWHLEKTQKRMYVSHLNWNPDGKKLAYTRTIIVGDGQRDIRSVGFLDVNDPQDHLVEEGRIGDVVTWSSDGSLLTYVRNPIFDEAGLVIYDVDHFCTVGTKTIPGQDGTSFWSPDGKVILIKYYSDLYFVNVEAIFGKGYRELGCGTNP